MTRLREYLPSGQFASMLGALVIAGGSITAASYSNPATAQLYASPTAAADLSGANPDWWKEFAGETTPQDMAAIQATADELVAAATGKNLTESIAKSLAINTLALQGQGIADSSYAQNQVVEKMLAAAESRYAPPPPKYSQTDIRLSTNGKADLHAYGNALPKLYAAYPKASEGATFLSLSSAVDRNSAAPLQSLTTTATQYRALSAAIVSLPTPPMLTPAAKNLANNYVVMAAAIEDMKYLHDDPVRGLQGLENYKSASNQNLELLLDIGAALRNSGIVYGKAEPGAAWNTLAATAPVRSAQ